MTPAKPSAPRSAALTKAQIEALIDAANERLAGEWDGFDGNLLERAVMRLHDMLAERSGEVPHERT